MPTSEPPIHLSIVQPLGEVDALRLLDPALSLQARLARRGLVVTIAKNRLVHDAVNVVFGAHLEFDPALRERYCCMFVNLEPLAGAAEEYLGLLRTSPVLDCDAMRVAALGTASLLRFLDDPELRADVRRRSAHSRRDDVLVLGGDSVRRAAALARLRAAGLAASEPEGPVHGPERDALARAARVVLDLAPEFDEPLASHVLALGTAFAWLREPGRRLPPDFDGVVHVVGDADELAALVRAADFDAGCQRRCDTFARLGVEDGCSALIDEARALYRSHRAKREGPAWRPSRINIGSGREYLPGWLNIDIQAAAQPDALIDLGRPLALPFAFESRFAGRVELHPGHADLVFASNVLEHVPDLVRFATQVLALLRTGGDFLVEVPYELAREAWQDPTHVRAMNENSWKYFTHWFWYLGWFEHRFELADMQYLDESLEPCGRDSARFMRVLLRKVETTPAERTAARAAQADCGGLLPPLHPHGQGGVLNETVDG